MPKFLIFFRVEQTLSGSIEVEAESAAAARELFENCEPGDPVDDARLAAKLDLEDSEDSIAEVRPMAEVIAEQLAFSHETVKRRQAIDQRVYDEMFGPKATR